MNSRRRWTAPALRGDADVVLPSPRGVAGKWHVDLKAANRLLLARAGVPPDAVDATPDCTCHDPARFFSYRRDRETGQLMGIVARSGPTLVPRRSSL